MKKIVVDVCNDAHCSFNTMEEALLYAKEWLLDEDENGCYDEPWADLYEWDSITCQKKKLKTIHLEDMA